MTRGFWGRLIDNVALLVTQLTTLLILLALLAAVPIGPAQGASSSNQLQLSGTLHNDASLVSSNGAFALGFFSSSNSRTLGFGIWYAQLPAGSQTVVWMPRRDVQLSSSAFLQLSQGGVLQLFDGVSDAPQQLWTSGNTLPGQVLQLGDDGNLVLLNATQGVLWQSFDTPTDTLLPGQVLHATSNRPLASWRGQSDYAEGYYFCSWVPINGSLSLALYWNGQSIPTWNYSSWSGNSATLANNTTAYPYQVGYPLSDFVSFLSNGTFYAGNQSSQSLVMNSPSNATGPLRRVTLDRDGSLRMYSWTFPGSKQWTLESSWLLPLGPCAVYAECGPYGLCGLNTSLPTYLANCLCPQGFVPIDPNDLFKGCKRQFEIPPGVCNSTKLEMIQVGYTDYPFADRSSPFVITNESDCIQQCLNNCRCSGAVFWRREGRCYVKSDPLFNGGFPQDDGNHTAYLKVLSSSLYPPSAQHNTGLIAGSVVAGAVLVCLVTALVAWRYCYKRRRMHMNPMFVDQIMCPRKFSLRELSAATKNFSQNELIGSGGMGSVFKGELKPAGTIIAVKCIRHEARGSEEGFLAEASSISQIRHRNLVQLKGWCIQNGNFMLVYDFMPNGSLDQWLYDDRSTSDPFRRTRRQRTEKKLTWNLRYSILTGIAGALTYLHEDWQQCVLHRDVKSSNVLLDAEFNAHLGDFGLARLIDHQKMEKTTLMAGTLGYMAPEMPYTGKATKETDVYSFGVLTLEVVCGRKPVISSGNIDPEDVILLHRVWRAYENDNLLSVVDPRLRGVDASPHDLKSRKETLTGSAKRTQKPDFDGDADPDVGFASALARRIEEEKMREDEQKAMVLKLGLLCCLPHPASRPSMRLVHQILTGDVTTLPPLPKTNQWSHLDVVGPSGFPLLPSQESESISSLLSVPEDLTAD